MQYNISLAKNGNFRSLIALTTGNDGTGYILTQDTFCDMINDNDIPINVSEILQTFYHTLNYIYDG